MKTFKTYLKEGISQGASGVGTPEVQAADNAGDSHAVENADVLKRVNAFVGSIAEQEYINPNAAVENLRNKLATIGLSFEAKLEGDSGTTTAEVKQFGGRFGKDTDGSDINDDGISHRKENGLKIEFKHETLVNGASKVYAKLV